MDQSNLCVYGCGNIAAFPLNAQKRCAPSWNSCPSVRKKNSAAVTAAHAHPTERRKNWYKDLDPAIKDRMAWSRGLTKDDHSALKAYSDNQKGRKFGASLTGYHTTEAKALMSRKRIEYLERSPHIKWMQLPNGLKVQGMWEYNVGIRLLEDGHTICRKRIAYDGHRRYTPDFTLEDGTHIEVKGWLSDRDVDKYRRVFESNPEIKVHLIRNSVDNNYKCFINRMKDLQDCEDLKQVVMGC